MTIPEGLGDRDLDLDDLSELTEREGRLEPLRSSEITSGEGSRRPVVLLDPPVRETETDEGEERDRTRFLVRDPELGTGLFERTLGEAKRGRRVLRVLDLRPFLQEFFSRHLRIALS